MESPLTERLVLLIVVLLLLGLYLASSGRGRRGVQGMGLLTLLAASLDSRYFFLSMHEVGNTP